MWDAKTYVDDKLPTKRSWVRWQFVVHADRAGDLEILGVKFLRKMFGCETWCMRLT